MAKIALIINGDYEPRHLKNVELAGEQFKKSGYSLIVASPFEPKVATDQYVKADSRTVSKLLEDLKTRITAQDELVVYVTGHGDTTGMCLDFNCKTDNIINQIDQLKYFKRVVIMDQCFGGNFVNRFVDDPKTLFIAAGMKDQKVCCGEFAPRFWSDKVPDTNQDEEISFQERYDNVFSKSVVMSEPVYKASKGFKVQSHVFESKVIEVPDKENLSAELKRLKPDQFAIITFSASWCGPCKAYAPRFKKYCELDKGAHLWLRTENEELARDWGITAYPTVVVVSGSGYKKKIEDPHQILSEMSGFGTPLKDRIDMARQLLVTQKGSAQVAAELKYKRLVAEEHRKSFLKEVKILNRMLKDKSFEKRLEALLAYNQILGHFDTADVTPLGISCIQFFTDPHPEIRNAAALIFDRVSQRFNPREMIYFLKQTEAFTIPATRLLLSLFKDLNHDSQVLAMQKYLQISPLLKHSQSNIQDASVVLRELFRHGDTRVRETAVFVYGRLEQNLKHEELEKGKQDIPVLFSDRDPRVRQTALEAYSCVLKRNPSKELTGISEYLIPMIDGNNIFVTINAIKVYQDFAGSLSQNDVNQAEKKLRQFFNHTNPQVREAALLAYSELSSRLSQKQAQNGAEDLSIFFKERPGRENEIALKAYSNLVDKLSEDEVEARLESLYLFFETKKPEVLENAGLVFYKMLSKISDDDVVEKGVQKLRFRFNDKDPQISKTAIKTYELFVGRFEYKEALEAVRTLNKLDYSRYEEAETLREKISKFYRIQKSWRGD